jgi:hypothetical protein
MTGWRAGRLGREWLLRPDQQVDDSSTIWDLALLQNRIASAAGADCTLLVRLLLMQGRLHFGSRKPNRGETVCIM